ncbi:MAG: hypothetical protein AB7V43_03875 [Acidimicrobiia bacterium]
MRTLRVGTEGVELEAYVFQTVSDCGGDDSGGSAGLGAVTEFCVDPDFGAVSDASVGNRVHDGHQGEVGVDCDVADVAVKGEHLISRVAAFVCALQHAIPDG